MFFFLLFFLAEYGFYVHTVRSIMVGKAGSSEPLQILSSHVFSHRMVQVSVWQTDLYPHNSFRWS